MTKTETVAEADAHTMRCLEVWGGNQAVDHGVVMPGLDAWLYSRPFEGQNAGGDLHYVSSCAAGLVTRVLVADVSGHGEKVAGMAENLRGLMRRYVNFIDQTKLVQGLNDEFSELSEAGGFATAVAATYLAPANQLTISNAGHPRPLWFRTKSKDWCLLGSETCSGDNGPINVPLGITETTYDQLNVKFGPGDMVVLYTDSLIEAKGADGQMLGTDGLLNVVKGLDPTDPEHFMRAMLGALGDKVGSEGIEQGDDVTVLILRANNMKPRPSLGMKLKSNWLMISEGLKKFIPGSNPYPWPQAGPVASLGAFLHRVNPRWGMAKG